MNTENLYETDFYAWCFEQSEALKNGTIDRLDLENLAEEIDSMGRRERSELRNRLIILFCHLLKMKFQPEYEHKESWISTIREQRICIETLIDSSPSLKYCEDEISIRAYKDGVKSAEKEMRQDIPKYNHILNTIMTLKEARTYEWFPE